MEKKIDKMMKQQHQEFQNERKKTSVARKREVLKLFAAKCKLTTDRYEPSAAEKITNMVGDASMFNPNLRDLSETILRRKGTIAPQSIEEKYNTVFKRYTLNPDELQKRLAEMRRAFDKEYVPLIAENYELSSESSNITNTNSNTNKMNTNFTSLKNSENSKSKKRSKINSPTCQITTNSNSLSSNK